MGTAGEGSSVGNGAEPKFTVTILDTGEQFRCNASQSLLNAMVGAGRRGIPSGCHGGGCGVCKIRVRNGTFHTLHLSRAHVSEAEQNSGYSLACQTYPESDIEVTVVGRHRSTAVRNRRYGLV